MQRVKARSQSRSLLRFDMFESAPHHPLISSPVVNGTFGANEPRISCMLNHSGMITMFPVLHGRMIIVFVEEISPVRIEDNSQTARRQVNDVGFLVSARLRRSFDRGTRPTNRNSHRCRSVFRRAGRDSEPGGETRRIPSIHITASCSRMSGFLSPPACGGHSTAEPDLRSLRRSFDRGTRPTKPAAVIRPRNPTYESTHSPNSPSNSGDTCPHS